MTNQNIPFIIIKTPNINKGIPIIAPTMVKVKITPIALIVKPSAIVISFPVNLNTLSTINIANLNGNNNNFI